MLRRQHAWHGRQLKELQRRWKPGCRRRRGPWMRQRSARRRCWPGFPAFADVRRPQCRPAGTEEGAASRQGHRDDAGDRQARPGVAQRRLVAGAPGQRRALRGGGPAGGERPHRRDHGAGGATGARGDLAADQGGAGVARSAPGHAQRVPGPPRDRLALLLRHQRHDADGEVVHLWQVHRDERTPLSRSVSRKAVLRDSRSNLAMASVRPVTLARCQTPASAPDGRGCGRRNDARRRGSRASIRRCALRLGASRGRGRCGQPGCQIWRCNSFNWTNMQSVLMSCVRPYLLCAMRGA